MPCTFQSLYHNENGYVVRCKECGLYQIGFLTTMLTLSAFDVGIFLQLVTHKLSEVSYGLSVHSKNILIETPSPEVCMILTRHEADRFLYLLERADSEAKALDLIKLFNNEGTE